MLFSSRALGMEVGNMEELKFVCGEVALEHALPKSEALSIVICAELAMGCFLQHYRSQRDDPRKARSPYQCLIAKDVTGEYLLPALVWVRWTLFSCAKVIPFLRRHRFGCC
uniref:Uncharacterized protein n=1 Tax=Eutreptiella gymnastica TaxID=73025 RepID=A0A7S4LFA5_9EUGL